MATSLTTADLPVAYPPLGAEALLRSTAADFCVEEVLGFAPTNEGEHLWLWVEKWNANTDWVARQLALRFGLLPKQVSYSGRKDRHAVTRQWFSLPWPIKKPLPEAFSDGGEGEGFRLLSLQRHRAKLKVGTHRANAFSITLREFVGDRSAFDQRLAAIACAGVPNYFGEQRFGHNGANLTAAVAWFKGERRVNDRNRRSLYLSSARAWIFNQICAQRVADGSWQQALCGDFMLFDGGRAGFLVETLDAATEARLAALAIHPSGALWGGGEPLAQGVVRAREAAIASACSPLATGLVAQGLEQERRALRLRPDAVSHHWLSDAVVACRFTLPAGSFATALLRELVHYREEGAGLPGGGA